MQSCYQTGVLNIEWLLRRYSPTGAAAGAGAATTAVMTCKSKTATVDAFMVKMILLTLLILVFLFEKVLLECEMEKIWLAFL